ncbi:hypothetical protein ACMZOO_15610 [Catenovulum sp. SX2]|uniref:hypothetical protein n=1 Tax=Catenovulum sp. SX2 TaxID=3398614 RepID=UPI003F8654A4
MKNLVLKTVVGASLLLPASVFAHPGHDHASAYADLVHLLWLAPIALAVVLLKVGLNRAIKNNQK